MEARLCKLESDMEEILHILSTMKDTQNNVQKSCQRMDNHISFVDNVYMHVRHPLTWIVNRFGNDVTTLPSIKTDTEKI